MHLTALNSIKLHKQHLTALKHEKTPGKIIYLKILDKSLRNWRISIPQQKKLLHIILEKAMLKPSLFFNHYRIIYLLFISRIISFIKLARSSKDNVLQTVSDSKISSASLLYRPYMYAYLYVSLHFIWANFLSEMFIHELLRSIHYKHVVV